MPYHSNEQLPESVRDHLPPHAQDIYRESFNTAHEQYKEEEAAHKIAWSAVKRSFEKNAKGQWIKTGS
jgi:cation transport regulator